MWEKRITHPGLQTFRLVKGPTEYDVDMKAASQIAIWDERWQRKVIAEQARQAKQAGFESRTLSIMQTAAAKALALERTRELELERDSLEGLLIQALGRDPKPSWEAKKDRSNFTDAKPPRNKALDFPPEPSASDPIFASVVAEPRLSLLDKLVISRRNRKTQEFNEEKERVEREVQSRFHDARALWTQEVARIKEINEKSNTLFDSELQQWRQAKNAFDARRASQHLEVDQRRTAYLGGDKDAIEAYLDDVLNISGYPDAFPRDHRFEYVASTKTFVLDFELPSLAALPTTKELKYIASRSEFQEVPVSEAWVKKTYDEVLYQVALRTLYELFTADEANVLVSVVFNGWVRSIDRSTGSEIHACVMTLEARKDEYLAINLRHVEPRACFKKLKGISASKLIELSPIKPLIMLNKDDERFVEGYAVVEKIDERTNLAAMDWLDFENLIRELFEKEFSKGGGEVKITQASRDGGVDAVAFDPDPIRGGKVVIQAKRYTNTVGVSAVRDLYGTVHNEGANKGILVTTSDFGPDAYAFAKDKPLTLLSGGELLYLLGQHGHAAKIDLAEARRIAAETS